MRTLGSVVARDYMETQVVTFTPDMEVMTAINELVKHGISGAPVLDEQGQLVGVLSEKDCLKVALTAGYEGVPAGVVREYMTPKVLAVEPETPILEIASRFLDSPVKRYPVVKNGKLVGQISRADVLRAINEIC
ncbi:MAG: CBS domain-containing protein [Nevskiaceae bacterium]|nr:MAG: CBS domain-containing protein [Nevskiaceae bacterium]